MNICPVRLRDMCDRQVIINRGFCKQDDWFATRCLKMLKSLFRWNVVIEFYFFNLSSFRLDFGQQLSDVKRLFSNLNLKRRRTGDVTRLWTTFQTRRCSLKYISFDFDVKECIYDDFNFDTIYWHCTWTFSSQILFSFQLKTYQYVFFSDCTLSWKCEIRKRYPSYGFF